MCGICGFWKLGADAPADVLAGAARGMADRLIHRGPDDSGVWVDEMSGVAFGHRRLSILDLSSDGAQPMVSGCGRFVIAYNGETYNFATIRSELEAEGRKLRGRSDTEVILEAIAAWGLEPALERANGMWAFALWDRRDRRLTLARDRAGKKPLYFGWSGDTFLFGSELKALVAHPEFRPEVDREALALFLRYGWIPGPRSIYRGVSKLEPGSFLHVEASGQQEPVSYWSSARAAATASADPFSGSAEEASDHLDALLRRAVSLRMVSDVPLGALLSGGIDSSTVVALMQEQSSRPVRTFSIGFNESEFDEAPHASAVAQHLGTQHTNLYVTPMETLDAIPKLPELYDEPFADVSQIPTFLLAQLTRRDVTVALSGDGGDELFLGYKRYFRAAAYWARLQRFPRWARRAAAELVRFRGRSGWWWDSLGSGWENPDPAAKATPWALSERHADRLEARNAVDLSRIRLGNRAGAKLVLGAREPDSVLTNSGMWPVLGNAMSEMGALDFMTYLRDDILVKVDRASMATSLEVRCPLLDREVVEFAWSLPVELRVRGGEGKHVLREVLGRYVPRELTDRKKQGFGVPIGDWLRGELRDWSESLLDEKRMHEAGFLDAEAVRRLWDQHQSRWADHSRLLWSVLMFQAWNEVRN